MAGGEGGGEEARKLLQLLQQLQDDGATQHQVAATGFAPGNTNVQSALENVGVWYQVCRGRFGGIARSRGR